MKILNIRNLGSIVFILIYLNGFAQQSKFKILSEISKSDIKVTASGVYGSQQSVDNLINDSGIKNNLHDNNGSSLTMWHTAENMKASSPGSSLALFNAWVKFDFATPQIVDSLLIWNHNQQNLTNRGFRKTQIFGSSNGNDWFLLSKLEIPIANGKNVAATAVVTNTKKPLKAIIIAAESNWGGNVYGLSEVKFVSAQEYLESELPFPENIEYTSTSVYRYCKDGKPGREVILNFKGNKLYQSSEIEVVAEGRSENYSIPFIKNGLESTKIILPSEVGVEKNVQIFVTLKSGNKVIRKSFVLPKQRQWIVYIYPHSHVDIGYTNTQANCEIIHKRNLVYGMNLAKETANYPEGARYIWNPEVTWPVERYLKDASEAEKEEVLDAIRKGFVHIDAGYINDNTSVTADEEFPRLFGDAKRLEKLTGVPVKTLVQVDIPGMSWGIIPMSAQFGIKYIFAPFNGSDRTGLAGQLSFKPFWWIGQDGVSKVLFLQPGDYTPGAKAKGYQYWPLMAGQRDPDKLLQIVKTEHPRENFIDAYLWKQLQELENDKDYPYDLFPMTWAMADNTPIDADLPDAVKSWNEEYAFPRLIIASSTDIMSAFENKYEDIIPEYSGDFTEYWTDGLGSAAKQTSMNRNTKERLIQTDVLWSMLHAEEKAPRAEINETWRNVLMGSEHTWCYMNPNQSNFQDEIFQVKKGYFETAEIKSEELFASTLQPFSTEKSNIIAVINTLSWQRNGLITISQEQSSGIFGVKDENNKFIESQRLSTGELVFFAFDIPAYGAKNYTLSTETVKQKGAQLAKGNTLDNGIFRVVIDSISGDIISIKDNLGIEFVDTKSNCNINSFRYLQGSADPKLKISELNAWTPVDLEPTSYDSLAYSVPTNVRIAIKENGPVIASMKIESQAEGCNSLTREVRVIFGKPEIEIENLVDKIATTVKEGIHFGFSFNIPDGRTRVDIPWGVVEIDADQLPGANRNWICFQRWLDISNEYKGISWCSLDAPTFESGNMTANVIGAALNSPQWIKDLPLSSTIYSWALNNHWHTNFPLYQEGKLRFRYRILPHKDGFDAVNTNRFGLEQAQALIAIPVKEKISLVAPIEIDNNNVVISIIKTSAEGKSIIVRLRSLSEDTEKVNLSFPLDTPKSIYTCVADEIIGEEVGSTINMLPYGITTLIIK